MDYDQLKEKYKDLVFTTLRKNRDILIESFVEYYGEEYRDVIERKYSQIVFTYYIDWNFLKLVVENQNLAKPSSKNSFIDSSNQERCSDLVQFYQDRFRKKSLFSKVFQMTGSFFGKSKELVGCTDREILGNQDLIDELMKSRDPICVSYRDKKLISFPILSYPEFTIIHEVHHALTSDWIADLSGNVEKSGLEVTDHKTSLEEVIEELLNEKASQEVTEIFHRRGGDFSSFCMDLPYFRPYNENFYLIDSFYQEFKPFIKKARITENKNELVQRVGKDNYQRYVAFVRKNYSQEKGVIAIRKKTSSSQLNTLLQKMKDNAKKAPTFTQEDFDQYYDTLRREGYTVTVLNQLDSNSDMNEKEEHTRRR